MRSLSHSDGVYQGVDERGGSTIYFNCKIISCVHDVESSFPNCIEISHNYTSLLCTSGPNYIFTKKKKDRLLRFRFLFNR